MRAKQKSAPAFLFMLMLMGCHSSEGSKAAAGATKPAARPAAILEAEVIKGRVICPLESINGDSVRGSRTFKPGGDATLVGWSTVADAQEPTPPMAFVVFRSAVPDGSADLFWPGIRVARPDLSSDPRRANAGYSANGKFPLHPGKYDVLVWVGDERVQHECNTGEVFTISG